MVNSMDFTVNGIITNYEQIRVSADQVLVPSEFVTNLPKHGWAM